MEDPMDRFDEFVTAAPLDPGQNPLLKPDKACSVQTPLHQTCKSAKLDLRTVHAKPGRGEKYVSIAGCLPRYGTSSGAPCRCESRCNTSAWARGMSAGRSRRSSEQSWAKTRRMFWEPARNWWIESGTSSMRSVTRRQADTSAKARRRAGNKQKPSGPRLVNF